MPFEKIAVAVDYSEFSTHAAHVADELARAFDATLTLIHVIPIVVPPLVDLTAMLPPLDLEKLASAAEADLRKLAATLQTPSHRVRVETPTGDPCAVLTDLSAQYDLMVVGTHGRRGVSRVLLGSVAERLARGAACPVFVARRPDRTSPRREHEQARG